ncbi:hypothetical protein Taro_013427, partial [Colocasia esculenta]|nr:hypothetical protein [Colocasia esculenta]
EHKPQFVSLLGEGFSSGELRLGDSVGGLGGKPWCFFASARFVGGGSWIVGARRWRVANLREGPLRLDLLIEGCAALVVAILMATWGLSPSQSEKGLATCSASCFHYDSRVVLQAAGFARVVDFGSSRGKRWDNDVVVYGALLAETDRSVSPSGSPDPWAAVPTVGSLVGAGDPGAGAVTVQYQLYQQMPAGGQQFAEMAAEEQPQPTPQAVPVQPEVPPVVRQQTPAAAAAAALEDRTVILERFLRLRPPTFVGDRDPDRAESWVNELEHTFETMDCAELDQGRRLEQISWQQFLEAFLGEYLPDYVCPERRDLFHELVQGDLTVGQYYQRFLQLLRHVPHVPASEQARTERFISGLRPDFRWAMAGHLCNTLSVAVARAMALERECRFQPQQSGGSGRSSLYQRPAGSRRSPQEQHQQSPQAQYRPPQPPQCQQQYQALLTVRLWIFQQVLEAQSADEDLADMLRLPEVDLTIEQGIATCPMSPSRLLKFVSLLGEGFSSGELRLGNSVGGLGGKPWCFFASDNGLVAIISVGLRRLGCRHPDGDTCPVAFSIREGLGNMLSVLLPLRLGFLGTCETSQQFPPRRSEETGP